MSDMDPGNFLLQIKQLITGSNLSTAADGGYLHDVDVTPQFSVYSTLGSTAGPGIATVSQATFISTAASTFGPFFVPRDYDATSDQMQFRFIASTGVAGNPSTTFQAALTIWTSGAGSTAASTSATQNSIAAFTTSQITNFGIDVSGNGLQYGDAFTIAISTSTGSTGIIAAAETYSSVLVAWLDYAGNALLTSGTVATEKLNGSTYEIRTR